VCYITTCGGGQKDRLNEGIWDTTTLGYHTNTCMYVSLGSDRVGRTKTMTRAIVTIGSLLRAMSSL